MKRPSDNLHKLIKSMTKSEKGYFLKSAIKNSSENKQYVKLFKAINAQDKYDEVKLKESLKDEPFVMQIHVMKNYLFKIIMRSLFNYNSEQSLNYRFSESLNKIMNFYNRGLYRESLKYILAAKEEAYKFEKPDFLLELIRWQKYVMSALSLHDVSEKMLELTGEESRLIKILKNIIEFRKLHTEISSLMRLGGSVRHSEEDKDFKKIINHPLMLSAENAVCYESKVLYYQICLIYHQAESDDRSTYICSGELIGYMNLFPQKLNEFSREYVLGMLSNLSSTFNLGKYDEASKVIENLRSFKAQSNEQKEYVFFSTYIIQIMMLIVKCDTDRMHSLLHEAEKQLKIFERKDNNVTQLLLYQNIFYGYFATGDYHKALIWINKILSARSEVRQDIYSIAKILNLILHFELNNIELLNYAVINTYRYLYKRKRLFKFEDVVLKFIRKVTGSFDIREEFRFLKSEVMKLTDDPYERIPMEYFDFISWLDSKIYDKPFIEVKRGKLLN